MTESDGETPGGDPIGSVGEEAAKLFDALQDWAKESGAAGSTAGSTAGSAAGSAAGSTAGSTDWLSGGLGDQWRAFNEHIATGGQDCTYCPVCQVIAKLREASPEVRTHLAVATSSLLQAAATLIEARAPRSAASEQQVTKIDLDDEDPSGREG